MAKIEIPSIVVQSGSHTPPVMDRTTTRTQWSLSTQSTFEDEGDSGGIPSPGEADHFPPPAGEKEKEASETKNSNNNNLPRTRPKVNLKLLRRSHALKESTSPPPDVPLSPVALISPTELPTTSNNNSPASLNNNDQKLRPILKRDNSNQSSDSNWSPSLSRGNSTEQQNEQASINIEQFLADTINGNAKDRNLLLKIEADLIALIRDGRKTSYKFGMMSSYQRMLVHRVAHYYGMEHNVDSSGQMVVVTKGKNTKMPANKLNYFVRGDLPLSEEPKKSILKRDSASFDESGNIKTPDGHSDAPRRSKSFEEREEEYEKARARIFHQEHGDQTQNSYAQDCDDELRWPLNPSSWEPQLTASADSTKLHPNSHRSSRLTKVGSLESDTTLRANSLRSSVGKSYSFGGYDQTSNSKVLTKQDSGSSGGSRVSPSSSGYKSQSQRSDATLSATPSPSATPHLTTQLSNNSQSGAFSPDMENDTVFWAVTSMSSVPIGSVLINPQTGQPVKNEDGSLYHFHPDNPPKFNSHAESNNAVQPSADNAGIQPESSNSASLSGGSGRSQPEPTGPSEPALTNTAPIPVKPPTPPTYRMLEEPHLDQEPCPTSIAQQPYHHMPPPAPTNVNHRAPTPTMYTSSVMFNTQNPYMQPQPVEASHPIMFAATVPFTAGAQQYTSPQLNPMDGQDLCNYLNGLSHTDVNRTDPQHRQLYFCPQPSPFSQGTAPGAAAPALPAVYFTPTPAAPPPQPTNHTPRYTQCTYQYPQAPDRTAAPECNYPQPGVHNYYSRCPSAQQASSSYFVPTAASAAAAAASMALMFPSVHTQAARPYHRLSTPPTTPQNVCATPYPVNHYTYAAMPGCYQHCPGSNPQTPMTLPSMMRPAMQLNVGNSPPLRAMRPVGYNPPTAHSPVVRDAAPPEAPRHNNGYVPPLQPSTSIRQTPYIYRLSFPTNDYMMVGNPRVSTAFTPGPPTIRPLASVSFPPLRRNRSFENRPSQLPGTFDSTPGGNFTDPQFALPNDSRPRTVGPTPSQLQGRPIFGASHQQAALATAIESAGYTDSNVNGNTPRTEVKLLPNGYTQGI